MSHIEAVTQATAGRLQFGRKYVTAADLLASSGVLTITLDDDIPGAWIEIESGAILRGIRLDDAPGSDVTDERGSEWVTPLTIVASPVAPYTVQLIDDDPGTTAMHRLWVPSSSTPGTFADGVLAQHQIVAVWDGSLGGGTGRWRFPYAAP